MASEQGGVSTAAPVFSANISEAPIRPTADDTIQRSEAEPTRSKSLKRARPESTYNPTNLSSIAYAGLVDSPSPKSPRFKGGFSPGYYAAPLTGAAAIEDERRRQEVVQRGQVSPMSENPGHKVMSSLMAGGGAKISRPNDAPSATTTMSEGLSTAANVISIPGATQYDDKAEISPVSASSLGALGPPAQTATASPQMVASPAAMNSAEPEARDGRQGHQSHLQPPHDEPPSNRALTFPGNLLAQADSSRGPARGMSLPMPGQQLAPRSPSQKKHKCPYRETEFTRHHNLKSHLLTHSQEKPYVCQTCTMRFRRLHDLKRHMKLHTGERPHICPKCDRKFARGDALARHSKGQGGCAGRRASMGSFAGDDDYDGSNAGDGEEGMDGVMYTNGNPNESEMGEEDPRRLSLPSIKAQHVSGGHGGPDAYSHSRVPSSYPPAGPRPPQSSGGLYPPGRDRAGSTSSGNSPRMQTGMVSNHTPNTSISSMPMSAGGSSMYSQSVMTESPKPLSPSAMQSHQLGSDVSSINRQRSPSLTTQFQQQQFGRRPSGRGSSPVISLPSPHGAQGPKLPALSNLAPPDSRYTLQTQALPNPPNGSHPSQLGQGPNATSPSTMFQPPMGGRTVPSMTQHPPITNDSNNLFTKGDPGLLSYVQQLEDKVKHLSEKVQYMEGREKRQEEQIGRLSEEVYALRSQLGNQSHPQQHHPQQGLGGS